MHTSEVKEKSAMYLSYVKTIKQMMVDQLKIVGSSIQDMADEVDGEISSILRSHDEKGYRPEQEELNLLQGQLEDLNEAATAGLVNGDIDEVCCRLENLK